MYEDFFKMGGVKFSGKMEDKEGNNYGVLFDVDVICVELVKEVVSSK